MTNSELDETEIEIIFSPNVTRFIYSGRPEDDGIFTTCLQRMPNLKYLYYRVENDIPDITSGLLNWQQKSKLEQLYITSRYPSINNLIRFPELLSNFIKCQEGNFSMVLNYLGDGYLQFPEDFLKYFSETADRPNEERSLTLRKVIATVTPSRRFILKYVQ